MALPKTYGTNSTAGAGSTATVANGATAVTGVGTAWNNIIKADDVFRVGGYSVRIASVTDNTNLVLAENWPGTSLTADPYEIAITYDGPEFQLRVRQLLEGLSEDEIILEQGAGIAPTEDGQIAWDTASKTIKVGAGTGVGTKTFSDDSVLIPTSYVSGMKLFNSTVDANNDVGITPGEWSSIRGGRRLVRHKHEMIKRLDAAWSAGEGGGFLDTGSKAISTLYYVYSIFNPTTGAVDAIASLNQDQPLLPSGYIDFRYRGMIMTDASGNIRGFTQDGDEFSYTSPTLDYTNLTLTDTVRTLMTSLPIPAHPTFVKTSVRAFNSAGSFLLYLSDPAAVDLLPAFSAAPLGSIGYGGTNVSLAGTVTTHSDSSRQIGIRTSRVDTPVYVSVISFRDPWVKEPPVAAVEFDWQLVTSGGRLDGVTDFGDGVLVTTGRDTAAGKVFRSTDYGDSWTLVQTLAGGESIHAVVNDGAGTGYLVTSGAVVWKSTNSGLSWTSMGAVGSASAYFTKAYGIAVLPTTGTVIVADTDTTGHIFRSTNGGTSWTDLGAVGAEKLYRLQVVGDGVICLGWDGNIYKSTNDGLTWADVENIGTSPIYAVEYLGSSIVLVASEAGVIYRSTDNGLSFSSMGTFDGAGDDMAYLGNGVVLYSTYNSNKHLYVSRDYGLTWKSVGKIKSPVAADHIDSMIPITLADGRPAIIAVTNLGVAGRSFLPFD